MSAMNMLKTAEALGMFAAYVDCDDLPERLEKMSLEKRAGVLSGIGSAISSLTPHAAEYGGRALGALGRGAQRVGQGVQGAAQRIGSGLASQSRALHSLPHQLRTVGWKGMNPAQRAQALQSFGTLGGIGAAGLGAGGMALS